jgi:glycosyltransferase involved in cell wall biosynthesis
VRHLLSPLLNGLRAVTRLRRSRGALRRSRADGPVRICFLIDRLGRGGSESQLLALIRHLDRRAFHPWLWLLGGEDAESRSLEPADCPVFRLGVHSLHHARTAARAVEFARFLRRERVDIVHAFFPDSTYFGVPVARAAGVPRVIRSRLNIAPPAGPLHRWLTRQTTRLVDATFVNCAACRSATLEHDGSTIASVCIIENGVEIDKYQSLAPRSPAPRIGLLANLRTPKDPQSFIRAARRVADVRPDATFLLAGEGELRPALVELIRSLGLENRVVLLGTVADVPAFLADLDVAVLCSRSEGMPNALLEYMARGLPIVATAVGGVTQLLQDGVTGLLVPSGAPDRLTAAILRLLADTGLAERLGEAARRRAVEQYSAAARARRFEAFYRNLLRVPDARPNLVPEQLAT